MIRTRRISAILALAVLALFAIAPVQAADEATAKHAPAAAKLSGVASPVEKSPADETLMDAVERLADSTASGDLAPVAPVRVEEPGMDPLERLVREHMNQVIAARNAYVAELQQAGLMQALEPARLESDTDGADGRRMVAAARAAADRFKARQFALIDAFIATIMNAEMSENARRGALAGIEAKRADGLATLERQFALEHAAFDQIEHLLRLLAGSDWHVEDDQFVFAEDADLTAFDESMAKLDAIIAEQTALQQRSLTNARAAFDRMER